MFHVLIALADGEKHGYAIIKEVARRTDGAIRLSAGTLYTLIRRFVQEGVIAEAAERPDPARACPAGHPSRCKSARTGACPPRSGSCRGSSCCMQWLGRRGMRPRLPAVEGPSRWPRRPRARS